MEPCVSDETATARPGAGKDRRRSAFFKDDLFCSIALPSVAHHPECTLIKVAQFFVSANICKAQNQSKNPLIPSVSPLLCWIHISNPETRVAWPLCHFLIARQPMQPLPQIYHITPHFPHLLYLPHVHPDHITYSGPFPHPSASYKCVPTPRKSDDKRRTTMIDSVSKRPKLQTFEQRRQQRQQPQKSFQVNAIQVRK